MNQEFNWNSYQKEYKKKNYKSLSVTLSPEEYNDFTEVCKKLGLTKTDAIRKFIKDNKN